MLNFIKVIDIRFLFGLTFSLANALRFFVQWISNWYTY